MSSVSPSGPLVGKRLGDYELLALLALGGTAEIYLARMAGHAGFEKYVVVKCLHGHLADDADFTRMFLDEARVGAQLDHSNIAHTLGLGEHEGRYYLVMEFLAGMSLAQIARKAQAHALLPGGLLPPALTLSLACQACAGLDYAHNRRSADGQPLNLVHRDISPQNLVLTYEGVLKIVDFGIARAEGRETQTKTGTIKGKFAYMSPEQALAEPLDRRTDIFALGTLLHELLTGRRLFKRTTSYHTYQAVISGNVPPLTSVNPNLDPALDELIGRALLVDREQRYPTAQAFGEAIQSYLHGQSSLMGSGQIADFLEQNFHAEHEHHVQRMRELIAGKPAAVQDNAWDDAELGGEPVVDVPADAADTAAEAVDNDHSSDVTPTERRPGSEIDAMDDLNAPTLDDRDRESTTNLMRPRHMQEVTGPTASLHSATTIPPQRPPGHEPGRHTPFPPQPQVPAKPAQLPFGPTASLPRQRPPEGRPSLSTLGAIAAATLVLVLLIRWIFF